MTQSSKISFLGMLKDNALLITFLSFSIYSLGFLYLKDFTELFGIDVFDLDLRSVDLFFAYFKVNEYLVVLVMLLSVMFFFNLFAHHYYSERLSQTAQSGFKIFEIGFLIFQNIALFGIVIYFSIYLLPKVAHNKAWTLMSSLPDECLVFKSQNKEGKDVLVKTYGRKIIDSSKGVWFYVSVINGKKISPVTMFIATSQFHSLYTPVRSVIYLPNGSKIRRTQ
jgi:hypothetical protein